MTSRPQLKVVTEENVDEIFVEVTIRRAHVHFYDDVKNDEIFQIILSTCNAATLDSLRCPHRFQHRARSIANNIFDMDAIPSGFISKGCILALRNEIQKKKTPEHFHGRQECGVKILEYVHQQLSENNSLNAVAIMNLVDKYRQVHFTSADENNRLGSRAKQFPTESWQDRYTACGVELIEYVPRKRTASYSID